MCRLEAVSRIVTPFISRFASPFAALTLLLGIDVQTAHAETTMLNTTVLSVQGYRDAIYFSLASGQAGENCPGGDYAAIIPNTAEHPAFAQEVALVLAAFLSGRTVDVTLSGCAASPSGGDLLPLVRYFTVKQR